jgi:hypothetical protein
VDPLTAVGPDAVASREKQAAAYDLDMSIGPDCRLKGRDPPGPGGRNAAYCVEIDCAIRSDTGNRSDPDAALELQAVAPIVLGRGDARDGECYEGYGQSADDASSRFAIPKFSTAIVIHFYSPLYLAPEGLLID